MDQCQVEQQTLGDERSNDAFPHGTKFILRVLSANTQHFELHNTSIVPVLIGHTKVGHVRN